MAVVNTATVNHPAVDSVRDENPLVRPRPRLNRQPLVKENARLIGWRSDEKFHNFWEPFTAIIQAPLRRKEKGRKEVLGIAVTGVQFSI